MNYYNIINVDYYSIKKVGLCTYKVVVNLSIENESKEFTGYILDPEYISELESIKDSQEQNDCYFQAVENQIENEVNEWLTHIY